MPIELKMPALSPTMEEGTLAKWLVKEGDEVKSGDILDESGVEAKIIVQQGEPVRAVRDYIGGRDEIAALVLGAAPSGNPGPLVANFCGNDSGRLPCPVMLIPGSLSDERLEQLS